MVVDETSVGRGTASRHSAADRNFYRGKLQACAFFLRWELPKTKQWAELLDGLDQTCLDMQNEWF